MMDLIGKKVLVRTVTHYYTGLLAGVTGGDGGVWLHLADAAWIADTGRFHTALATGTDALQLFLDIGTNGEIVVGNGEWLMACACSAGPAFEGCGIGCGMRAWWRCWATPKCAPGH